MTLSPSTSLAKPSVTDTRQVRLTSRMVHIGSAVSELTPFEYVREGRFVYLPDQDELAKALRQRGREYLNDYIARVEQRENITSLLKKAFGEDWTRATGETGRAIFPRALRSVNWAGNEITKLRPMIRNGFGHHYIPGSSIKGAIRTAIAYHLLKHSDRYQVPQASRVSAIESQLRQSMGELKRKAKFADDSLFMDELFGNFGLTYQGREVRARQGPNTDIMRAVSVSDSEPLIEQKIERDGKRPSFNNLPVVAEVVVSSRFPDYKAKFRASIYAEMVFNAQTQFTLSVDHDMLSWFRHNRGMALPFESVDDLLKICQDFAQEQWDFEHDYWATIVNNPNARDRNVSKNLNFDSIQDLYEPEACPHTLRLGWGSGLRGTTINLLLPDETVREIRDTCGLRAPGFEAPKSRRTIMNSRGEIRYVPGWVKLEAL
ncbi:MAG: type III-A CRISPR-associated RAMP protein Csm5 [Kaiparowitsia implicata GSE-PSE-MK54-09C]|jgi:CRISPR-associated protein Csm5|nr:type III-A CRISPR-associated RAMP protein Csm5 [Kaiparowitsia implicata GSE-PSE-MK54-09C]